MARRRFFVDEIHRGQAELTGDDAQHLTRVLRVEAGQVFEISDNRTVYLAEVSEARKSRVVFEVREKIAANPPPVRVVLLVSIVKFERLEWIFEKGTEVGVERFVPVIAERSEKGLDLAAIKRMERWQRIALESAQQCRRDQLPEISPPVKFRDALTEALDCRYLLDEASPAAPLLDLLPERERRMATDTAGLLVGPEGGWTDAEREMARRATWECASVSNQILRAETAAIVGAALVATAWASTAAKLPHAERV